MGAAMAGLMTKQLTQPSIEKHLVNFGVDPESASHTQINQLSGGMKVKVVLAACMWQNPHVLILDEPTNYLDREGLGALVLAIKEFCDGVATEKWIMKGGYLRIEGESVDTEEKNEDGNKQKKKKKKKKKKRKKKKKKKKKKS